MTQANDSILITPGSGATVATHLANSKKHQVVVGADESGQILGAAPTYRLYVPPQVVAANRVYFDLFNATGTLKTLKLRSVNIIKDGTAAVTGALATKLCLTRTTTIGATGTAAVTESTSLTVLALSQHNPADSALPAGVTARLLPTGATAGAVLAERRVFGEETSDAGYAPVDFMPYGYLGQPIFIPENTGIRVVNGVTADVGNVGFDVIFEAV